MSVSEMEAKLLDENAELCKTIDKLQARIGELENIMNEIKYDATPNYATERNCKAVRKGYAMSGSIRHYEVSTYLITALKNKLEKGDE